MELERLSLAGLILGMKFKRISFKSSEKTHLLGFLVRKDVSMPRSSPPANGRGTASWGFSAELLGNSRLSTDRLLLVPGSEQGLGW